MQLTSCQKTENFGGNRKSHGKKCRQFRFSIQDKTPPNPASLTLFKMCPRLQSV